MTNPNEPVTPGNTPKGDYVDVSKTFIEMNPDVDIAADKIKNPHMYDSDGVHYMGLDAYYASRYRKHINPQLKRSIFTKPLINPAMPTDTDNTYWILICVAIAAVSSGFGFLIACILPFVGKG